MGRARYTSRELHCHSCDRRWWGTIYALDDHMRDLHTLDPRKSCNRCSVIHGEGTVCKFIPETCTCLSPHVEIIYPESRGVTYAQVRAEQRAVVYMLPDGSTSVPSSNRYDDEIALDAVAQGGVRHEFMSVRDMQRFQKDRRQYDNDEYTDRCMVIDHDQSTILRGDTILRDRIKKEDKDRRGVLDRTIRGEVYYGGEYYERARAAYERRNK